MKLRSSLPVLYNTFTKKLWNLKKKPNCHRGKKIFQLKNMSQIIWIFRYLIEAACNLQKSRLCTLLITLCILRKGKNYRSFLALTWSYIGQGKESHIDGSYMWSFGCKQLYCTKIYMRVIFKSALFRVLPTYIAQLIAQVSRFSK